MNSKTRDDIIVKFATAIVILLTFALFGTDAKAESLFETTGFELLEGSTIYVPIDKGVATYHISWDDMVVTCVAAWGEPIRTLCGTTFTFSPGYRSHWDVEGKQAIRRVHSQGSLSEYDLVDTFDNLLDKHGLIMKAVTTMDARDADVDAMENFVLHNALYKMRGGDQVHKFETRSVRYENLTRVTMTSYADLGELDITACVIDINRNGDCLVYIHGYTPYHMEHKQGMKTLNLDIYSVKKLSDNRFDIRIVTPEHDGWETFNDYQPLVDREIRNWINAAIAFELEWLDVTTLRASGFAPEMDVETLFELADKVNEDYRLND